ASTSQSPPGQRDFEHYALTNAGDPQRGRELFSNESLTKCVTCHKINGQGGEAGPDLSHIGGKFDRPHLIESVLEPSRQIVEGYRTTIVDMVDGGTEVGVVKAWSDRDLTLADARGTRTIPLSRVKARRESAVSLMPEGIAAALT